jgi:hypothetical protein
MKLRAIERGYDNIKLREPGEVFDWPDHLPPPKWTQDTSLPYDQEAETERQRTATFAKGDRAVGLPVEMPEPTSFHEAQTRRGRPRREA